MVPSCRSSGMTVDLMTRPVRSPGSPVRSPFVRGSWELLSNNTKPRPVGLNICGKHATPPEIQVEQRAPALGGSITGVCFPKCYPKPKVVRQNFRTSLIYLVSPSGLAQSFVINKINWQPSLSSPTAIKELSRLLANRANARSPRSADAGPAYLRTLCESYHPTFRDKPRPVDRTS